MTRIGSAILIAVLFLSSSAWAGEVEELILKGSKYSKEKEYEKAIVEFKKAVQTSPNHVQANLLLALAYASVGKLDDVIKHAQVSLGQEKSYTGYNILALALANKRELEKAAEAYKEALQLNPTSYRSWYQLGLVYASDLKFRDAIECYEKVLEINPRFTDARLGLGSAYYWSGDIKKANEQVDALREAKDNEKAQALKNWIENKENQKTSAEDAGT